LKKFVSRNSYLIRFGSVSEKSSSYLVWKQNKAYFNEKYEIITKEKPRNVFFDPGANIGDSAENFLGFIEKASNFNDI